MTFYNERLIKSIRKARPCHGCNKLLEAGQSALECAGVGYDGFWAAAYHTECRAAEVAINRLHRTRDDEWISLFCDLEWEDWPWLIDEHPVVAERMKIDTAKFERVRDERERVRLAWAEIDRKRLITNKAIAR